MLRYSKAQKKDLKKALPFIIFMLLLPLLLLGFSVSKDVYENSFQEIPGLRDGQGSLLPMTEELTLAEFQGVSELVAVDSVSLETTDCEVSSFTAMRSRGTDSPMTWNYHGKEFHTNHFVNNLKEEALVGDYYTFLDIKCQCPNGETRELDAMIWEIIPE